MQHRWHYAAAVCGLCVWVFCVAKAAGIILMDPRSRKEVGALPLPGVGGCTTSHTFGLRHWLNPRQTSGLTHQGGCGRRKAPKTFATLFVSNLLTYARNPRNEIKQREKKIAQLYHITSFLLFHSHSRASRICGEIADWYAGAGPLGNRVRWKKNRVIYS
jgi:hypothetical protein